jgi:hypothetical protein
MAPGHPSLVSSLPCLAGLLGPVAAPGPNTWECTCSPFFVACIGDLVLGPQRSLATYSLEEELPGCVALMGRATRDDP